MFSPVNFYNFFIQAEWIHAPTLNFTRFRSVFLTQYCRAFSELYPVQVGVFNIRLVAAFALFGAL